MAGTDDPLRSALRDETPFVEAAWLYYHDGLNQAEIAERMKVSRASVVNYLAEARARGWVRVHLDSDVFRGNRLAAELCAVYGLADALVVPDEADQMDRVTRAAADWLPRLLVPGDRLGVSWGETVYRMAQQMAHAPIAEVTVVQLLGSRPVALGFAAETCTSILAQRLAATCINLHVPLLLSSEALRDDLVREPVVAEQLRMLAGCNKTVLACGTCDGAAHIVHTGLFDAAEIAAARDRGATGVVCARLIDGAGQPLRTPIEDRMIGVSLEDMRDKEMSLLVAGGAGRAASARAAILGGYVTHLATSSGIAAELLAMGA